MIQAGKIKISTVVISTALGRAGRGIFPYTLLPAYQRLLHTVRETGTMVLTKSVTRFKRRGNFIPWNPLTWRYIKRLPGLGMLNAYGLTNEGVEACAPDILISRRAGFKVIPNLYPEFIKGTEIAIRETLASLEVFQAILGPNFWALELNFSCPNSAEEVADNVAQSLQCVREIRKWHPRLFLIVKISICHPYEFSQELEKAGVGAIHAINTIPYDIIFPPGLHPSSPLRAVGGGGVSGGPAFAAACRYNADLRQQVNLPLIMGCGVTGEDDVKRYLDLGADAVSLCTLALRNPKETAKIIRHYNSLGKIEKNGKTAVNDADAG
jgi:dihydroorotate dehydrogenase